MAYDPTKRKLLPNELKLLNHTKKSTSSSTPKKQKHRYDAASPSSNAGNNEHSQEKGHQAGYLKFMQVKVQKKSLF